MNLQILLLSSLLLAACTPVVPVLENNNSVVDIVNESQNYTVLNNTRVLLREGQSITVQNMRLTFITADQRATFTLNRTNFSLREHESIQIGNLGVALLSIAAHSHSYADLSARIFGFGGARMTLEENESRILSIGNGTYHIKLAFVGQDSTGRNTVLMQVNNLSKSLQRHDDSEIGGLFIFVHDVYPVRTSSQQVDLLITQYRNQ